MLRRLIIASIFFFAAPSVMAQTEPDKVDAARPQSKDVDRVWLYNDEPTIPAPFRVVASLSNTYSGNDRSVTRAFSSKNDGPGGKAAASVQLGLYRMFAVEATGVVGGFGNGASGGLMAGARFAPFDGAKHGFRLAVSSGYLLDLDQTSGFYARVSATYDIGRLRLGTTIHGEHAFRDGSDPVDLFITAGASVRIIPELRVGVEYIAQDVEEAFAKKGDDDDDDTAPVPGAAEGGVHQFLGLVGTIELLRHRLFINFGPALAFRVEVGKVEPVGRAVVSYSF